MKTAVLFDLDGTLLDTLEDLTDSVNASLAQFGYPPRTPQEIRSFLGCGAENLVMRSMPEGVDHKEVFAFYQSWYPAHSRIKTKPYAGILEAVAEIAKTHPVAVVSNKPDLSVKLLCEEMFPGVYALGQTSDCPHKPAPDMLYKTLKHLGADTCIYVGDTEIDIETAKNAGVPCVTVTWGFRDEDVLLAHGANYLCHTPADLPEIIQKIAKN